MTLLPLCSTIINLLFYLTSTFIRWVKNVKKLHQRERIKLMNEIHIDPNDINNANVKLFVCGQPMFKMHPMFFDRVVKKILDRDIDSHVILLRGEFDQWTTSMADRLSVVLNNYGKESPGRIHIIPRRSREDFLKLLASADVVLDTYPFGGGKLK